MKTRLLLILCLGLLVLGAAQLATAADWELWPDKNATPPNDQMVGLPIVPEGGNIVIAVETDSSWIIIDVHQTLEKDGQQYKALQWFQDTEFTATVPAGKWLIGLLGIIYPMEVHMDVMAQAAAMNLVAVEIDGTTIPIDASNLFGPGPVIGPEAANFADWESGGYSVFPRFNTPGPHTYVQKFQYQNFYYVECYEACGAADPSPEFEGRRVLVPEQIGNPVDGYVVFKYNLNVVAEPTAVAPKGWGEVKQEFMQDR
jgi:hypothetical protein